MESVEEERIAIYSYRASLRWAYVACFLIVTLILGSLAVWIELAVIADDDWYDTLYGIMTGLGLSGLVSVIVTIFVLEVGTVLADIVGKRKVEERLAKAEAERDAAQAEKDAAQAEKDAAQERAAKAEAEVERLRRIIEGNGSN